MKTCGQGWEEGEKGAYRRGASIRKCSVREEQQVSTGPLENIVVINKTFLLKQAL